MEIKNTLTSSKNCWQISGLKPGEDIEIREIKTHKPRRITLNKACITAINGLLASRLYKDEDKLFQGQRGPITVSYFNRLVKGWAKALNLRSNFGSHTLRKTFGYIKHTEQGASLPELMVCFNHSTQRQTLDYLCIQEATIRNIYMNEI